MLNRIVLMGRLVADPELKITPTGVAVTSFRIAVDRNYVKPDTERQADFINVIAWRQKAGFLQKYFSKGKLIALDGSLHTRSYQDKNGNKRWITEVVAENIYFTGDKRESDYNDNGNNSINDLADEFEEVSLDDLPF